MPINRVYLQSGEGRFARLLWFKNNKDNEMLMGFSGLSQKQPILSWTFPEFETDDEKVGSLTYNWKDAEKVEKRVDHVTIHADGTFHIKTKEREDLYIHEVKRPGAVGVDSSTFLEFIVMSDICRNYKCTAGSPRKGDMAFGIEQDHVLWLRGMFSGINYDLEDYALRLVGPENLRRGELTIRMPCRTLKGILLFRNLGPPPRTSYGTRPPGTQAFFNLKVGDKALLKTFMFR